MISLILSGGVGSRLWPLSREKLPKQFSSLFQPTLFVQTVQRQQKLGEVMVCTAEAMRSLTELSIRKESLQVSKSFYEPIGRNTAPAIALVCKYLQLQKRESEILGVFPSDHWINKQETFFNALALAQDCAMQDQIATIGLKPTHPATGFGYIECEQKVFAEGSALQAFSVKGFREKPDLATAEEYIKQGRFFWNGGMFVFKVSTMISAFEEQLPALWKGLEPLTQDLSNIQSIYENLDSISIDYGIMEKIPNQVNIPCDIGWSDLGSWDDVATAAAAGLIPQQENQVVLDSKNCFAFSDNEKVICFSGVEDLILVDTDDALLVTRRGQSQSVKNVVDRVKETRPELAVEHVYESRPWGFYKNLYEENSFKTKVIEVDPGQQLSYQSHTKRMEIWITTQGQGEVVLNDQVIPVSPGKVVEIPVGAKHRMRNTGQKPLKFVEVQLGEYFGEDDITRYQDDYQRL